VSSATQHSKPSAQGQGAFSRLAVQLLASTLKTAKVPQKFRILN